MRSGLIPLPITIVDSIGTVLWIFILFLHLCVLTLESMFLYLNESHLEVGGIIDSRNEIFVQTRQ